MLTAAVLAFCSWGLEAPRVYEQPPSSQVFARDFNGDGLLDLGAVAQGTFTVRYNVGGGRLSLPRRVETPLPVDTAPAIADAIRVVAGDTNGDGREDIVALNDDRITIRVFEGRGNGKFAAPRVLLARATLTALAVGDLDGDRRDEIVTVSQMSEVFFGRIEIFDRGQAPSTLHQIYHDTFYPRVDVHDLHGDGKGEIILSTGTHPQALRIYRGERTAALTMIRQVNAAGGPIAFGDFTGDGVSEIVIPTPSGFAVTPPFFEPGGTSVDPPHAIGDIDRDGADDFVFQRQDHAAVVAMNDGQGAFTYELLPWELEHYGYGIGIKAGQIVFRSPQKALVFSRVGRRWRLAQTYVSPGEITSAEVADLNGNGLTELIVMERSRGGIDLVVGARPPRRLTGDYDWARFTAADLNRDGYADLLVAALGPGPAAGAVSVHYGNGDGTFDEPLELGQGRAGVIHTGDFNGDAGADVAFMTSRKELVIVYADGNGFAEPAAFIPTPRAQYPFIRVADVNGDGITDILVGADPEKTIFYGTRGRLLRGETYWTGYEYAELLRLRRDGPHSLLTTFGIVEGVCHPVRQRGVRH